MNKKPQRRKMKLSLLILTLTVSMAVGFGYREKDKEQEENRSKEDVIDEYSYFVTLIGYRYKPKVHEKEYTTPSTFHSTFCCDDIRCCNICCESNY